jgi:hypothetical protein
VQIFIESAAKITYLSYFDQLPGCGVLFLGLAF